MYNIRCKFPYQKCINVIIKFLLSAIPTERKPTERVLPPQHFDRLVYRGPLVRKMLSSYYYSSSSIVLHHTSAFSILANSSPWQCKHVNVTTPSLMESIDHPGSFLSSSCYMKSSSRVMRITKTLMILGRRQSTWFLFSVSQAAGIMFIKVNELVFCAEGYRLWFKQYGVSLNKNGGNFKWNLIRK